MKNLKSLFKSWVNQDKTISEMIVKSVCQLQQEYINTLVEIAKILYLTKQFPQEIIVVGLIDKLEKGDYLEFVNQLKSADMWGGSGSVWEVGIDDNPSEKMFQRKIIELIWLMEKSGFSMHRISRIKKLFENELND